MMEKRIVLFCYFLCLMSGSLAQNCPKDLMNQVVYEGNSTTLYNAKDGQHKKWQVSPASDAFNNLYDITDFDNTVNPVFTGAYTVNATELDVVKATIAPEGSNPYSTAGIYLLTYQNTSCVTAANLIVVQSGPECTSDTSDPNNANVACSITYAESYVQPSFAMMTWTTNTGNVVVSNDQPSPTMNNGILTSVSRIPVDVSGASIYQCQVTFSSPSQDPLDYMALNAPVFSASCSILNPVAEDNGLTTTRGEQTTASDAQRCPKDLVNQVVYYGNSATLYNANDGQPPKWQMSPASDRFNDLYDITNFDNTVSSTFAGVYTVNATELDVVKATIAPEGSNPYSTAGMYLLTYQNTSCVTAANLIVIQSGPECNSDTTDPNNVIVTCSITYVESHIQQSYPMMTWTTNTGDVVVSNDIPDPTSNGYVDQSVSQIVANVSGASIYQCQVTFSSPSSYPLDYVSQKAPSFSASCIAFNPFAEDNSATTSSAEQTTTAPVSKGCPMDLTNKVVYEGDSTVFQNLDDGQPVKWQFAPSSRPYSSLVDITNYDNTVNPMFTGVYEVNRTTLKINKATVGPEGTDPYSTAGIYVVTYQNTSCMSAANLIVIQGGPVCAYNVTDQDDAVMTCSITYAESHVQPSYPTMTWSTNTGIVIVSNDKPTPTSDSIADESVSEIPVNGSTVSTYQCQVTFSAPDHFPICYLATNAPSFTASCTVANPFAAETTTITTTEGQSTAETNPFTTDFETTTENRVETTGQCIDQPTCGSRWVTALQQFCNNTPEFRADCPSSCKAC